MIILPLHHSLPACCGGCSKRRLAGECPCKSYKDDPERYVLAALEHVKLVHGRWHSGMKLLICACNSKGTNWSALKEERSTPVLRKYVTELQEKVKPCKTAEELFALAKEKGIELTDEQLEAISDKPGGTELIDYQAFEAEAAAHCAAIVRHMVGLLG